MYVMLVLMSYFKVVDLKKSGNVFHELCVLLLTDSCSSCGDARIDE